MNTTMSFKVVLLLTFLSINYGITAKHDSVQPDSSKKVKMIMIHEH